jgi:serine/threonine-protein kinase HipA
LVSRRFDRAGSVATRIHQEDFCQALAFPSRPSIGSFGMGRVDDRGNDDADGPGFAESSGLLKAVGAVSDIPTLVTAAFANYVLGNGDATGKNFALMHHRQEVRLAPLYDLTSTAVYEAPIHAGMVISEDYDETVYLIELARMSEECGFDFGVFRELASDTAAKIGESLGRVAERARREGWHAPVIDQIVEMASERAFGLGAEVEF